MKENIDSKTYEQIREHYKIEKELARRLRDSTREERRRLYTAVYDELFRRLPHHPILTRKRDAHATQQTIRAQMRLLKRFLGPTSTFLELGPGDCSLAFEVATHVRHVYAVDVSPELTRSATTPKNFTLTISDGCTIPLPANSVDFAYSNQLMEHLHPDDALEQLHDIYRVLVSGGMYLCVTPNRLSGPHDVSRHFDRIATGFHLREYTNTELDSLFREVGFRMTRVCIGLKGRFALTDVRAARWCESVLCRLPQSLRRRASSTFPIPSVLGIRLLAVK